MDTTCFIVIFPSSWTRHGHCWKTGKTCSWRWVQLQLQEFSSYFYVQFQIVSRIVFFQVWSHTNNCQVDCFLLRSKGSGVEDTSSTSQTFSVERVNEEVRWWWHCWFPMLVGGVFWPMTQGEVVSEWLDVDEVEEAFAKMRRAAGVRISILEPTITLDAISFFVKRWETW